MSISPSVKRGKQGAKAVSKALDDAIRLDSFAVAALPAAASHTGKLVHCTNGAAGSPCLAYSNGTDWLRIVLGAAVATS
jgi:hypothetical protein